MGGILCPERKVEMSKNGKILVTTLGEMASSQYEKPDRKNHFRPIYMPALGYGYPGCKDTESDFYESVGDLIRIAKEERSFVFILGYGPRVVTSQWVKAAELIVRGSEVKVCLVPMCEKLDSMNDRNPTLRATVLHIEEAGIVKAEFLGEKIAANKFFDQLAAVASLLDREYRKAR